VLSGKGERTSKNRGKEEIVKSDPSAKNLRDRVFVVQFSDPTESGSTRFAGRAEHVMSAQSTGFETPEELVDFLGRVMNQLKPPS
jgi:hypothetical protein